MKDVPIGFSFQPNDSCPLIRVVPPEEGHVYAIRGLWMAVGSFTYIIDKLFIENASGSRNLIPRPTPASSFDAAPRADGLPRHVELPVGEITSTRALIIQLTAVGTPLIPPWVEGHAVGRWIRKEVP